MRRMKAILNSFLKEDKKIRQLNYKPICYETIQSIKKNKDRSI